MSLTLDNPQQTIDQLVAFIKQTFADQKKQRAVIAVSGGIDSAVALTLLTKAIGSENVMTLFLPFADQSIEDGMLISKHVDISGNHMQTINIKTIVDSSANLLVVPEEESVRSGNLKARARMMCVYDVAKLQKALVCGTENKSEHYLGYFTRFGDAASDLEPISTLYKTQVRQLAEFLQLPKIFLEKPPSAGLWTGQTDEAEMGFTYKQADQVLEQLIDQKKKPSEIKIEGIRAEVIEKVVKQVEDMSFKLKVPYELK